MSAVQREHEETPFKRFRHAEVRYEVTDHCNAECIMGSRDEHKLGRPYGIMNAQKYEKSIDGVVALGCQQVVLTSFGELLIARQAERGNPHEI